jgi:hypothetical protein
MTLTVKRALAAAAVVCGLGALAPVGAGGTAGLSRATVDRRDDRAGLQVHAMYVVPSDGPDRVFDTSGGIANAARAFQRWLSAQTGGRALRLDTFRGKLDVTFHRLDRTDAEIAAGGLYAHNLVEEDLRSAGLVKSKKVYAVFYDGTNALVCGGAAWPPEVPGNAAVFNLQGAIPGHSPCFAEGFPARGARANYTAFAMFHDVMHTMGVVGRCAPHHSPDYPAHVSDSSEDLMYSGPDPWRPSILDAGRDDYYRAAIPGCPDLATAGFLTSDRSFRLTVVKKGRGAGNVRSDPWPLIACGRVCAAPYGRGTLVTLTAQAEEGSVFTGWQGACQGAGACVVRMNRKRGVSARFFLPPSEP